MARCLLVLVIKKAHELQDSDMDHDYRSPKPTHSDISLVDAAVILVRHWLAFLLSFLIALTIGVGYAVTADDQYEFVSLYQLAEKSPGEWLQSPAVLVARVEDRIFPQYESSFQRDKGHLVPFEVTVSSPESAGTLSLATIAEHSKSELIENAHRHVVAILAKEQNKVLGNTRSRLENEIAEIETALEDVRGIDASAPYVGELYRSKAQLLSELNGLEPGEVVSVAQPSVRPVSPDRKIIVVGSIIGGIFFGIVIAFLSDFVSRVRLAFRE